MKDISQVENKNIVKAGIGERNMTNTGFYNQQFNDKKTTIAKMKDNEGTILYGGVRMVCTTLNTSLRVSESDRIQFPLIWFYSAVSYLLNIESFVFRSPFNVRVTIPVYQQ